MLFHINGEFITFPFNNTCLSTEWGMIPFVSEYISDEQPIKQLTVWNPWL